MHRLLFPLALLAICCSVPAGAQPIPEDQLCLSPSGIGALQDSKCRPLPGDKRKIKPEQLPLHLRNDFRLRLRVVSDDTPDEGYNLSSLHKNDTVTDLDLYREGPIDLSTLPHVTALQINHLNLLGSQVTDYSAIPPKTSVRK